MNSTLIGPLYDSSSMMVDTLIYDYDDALVVFAAGNEGGANEDDVFTGDHSISVPSTMKNVLTVGAAETKISPDTVASFSSRGPTTDYRIKPDLCCRSAALAIQYILLPVLACRVMQLAQSNRCQAQVWRLQQYLMWRRCCGNL